MTSNNYHAALEKLTIYKDVDTKLHKPHLSTLDEIIEDDIKKSNAKFMKEFNCKHDDCKGFRLRDEILNCVISIEKN